jgi:hyperosmotically inducible protein
MQKRNALGLLIAVLVAGLVGCTAMTGKTAGTNIDDAAITASVKTKLVTDRFNTLTTVDVDTVRGTVYLNGTVPDEAAKLRATELAGEVEGVRHVENNLQTRDRAAGDAPPETAHDRDRYE